MVLLYIWSEIKIQRRGKEDPMTASIDVLDLVGRWAEAEQGNDAEALDGLLAGDFVGVGLVGFVLGRDQWLAASATGWRTAAPRLAGEHTRRGPPRQNVTPRTKTR
jgi:hypothetical protein